MLPSSDVGELWDSMLLQSIFIRLDESLDRCLCGFGERILEPDAERILEPDAERDRAITLCFVLPGDGIDPPLLDFRTPFLRVLRTVRDTAVTLSVMSSGLLSNSNLLTVLPSCVTSSLSGAMIADGVDKCR